MGTVGRVVVVAGGGKIGRSHKEQEVKSDEKQRRIFGYVAKNIF